MTDWEIIGQHIVDTLPDSISARRRILEAAIAESPCRSGVNQAFRDCLASLDRHLTDQAELDFAGQERRTRQ